MNRTVGTYDRDISIFGIDRPDRLDADGRHLITAG